MHASLSRRDFLKSTLAASATAALPMQLALAGEAKKTKLRIAVKYGMINHEGSIEDKFNLIKKLGLQGVEVDSPSGLNKAEAKAAAEKTGIVIHGVIDSVHWRDTLSSSNADVRAKGLAALNGAIEDAAFFGCDTVLLVPGVVKDDVTFEQCYERSQAEIKKALPLAEKHKVKICIETVWNNFITKPEHLISFVDDLKSPWAGAYFDCSNMLKYGVSSAEWIRKLGKRLVKFDFKGYSHKNSWCKIGEGDEDWPEVLKALGEIGYDGWATSEVGGGGEKELADITARMKKVLGLI
ncbi:MAG: sugar phosphate isomerase/epimerase [Planctomycetes bacterium]|nr:sugar phosphate isomerase/epimerase [Planctomycetota bacterium]